MKKSVFFDIFKGPGWPRPEQLQHYFLAPRGQEWFYANGNDSAGLSAEGVDGTEQLEANKGRIDLDLDMWGNPNHGVLLIYSKWGGGHKEIYSSKGDLGRLREWVRTLQGDLRPVGLYIPFDQAWKAVKEFIETDGKLPKSIGWVANRDLPPNTFPDP